MLQLDSTELSVGDKMDQHWPSLLKLSQSIKKNHVKAISVFQEYLRTHTKNLELKLLNLPFSMCDADLSPIRLYLPIIANHLHAHHNNGVFVLGHLAQTLDGKIATENGHSQWISNHANLKHVHRLRALSDSVLVGWKTLLLDNCLLTVRHVEGENPKRIILDPHGQLAQYVENLDLLHDKENPVTIIVCDDQGYSKLKLDMPDQVVIAKSKFNAEDILETIKNMGVYSLFIEGGAQTLSLFYEQLTLLHLHISPKILGSGISSFFLSPIDNVENCKKLKMDFLPFDDELLIECRPI